MKRLLFALLLPLWMIQGAEPPPDVSELLRQGLFAEDGLRDLKQAAKAYQTIVDSYTAQRKYAGTALFRLAEIERKEGHRNPASKLYQRVIAEFAEDETLVKLSQENLAGMGIRAASTGTPVAAAALPADDEEREIARITELVKHSPDLINTASANEAPPLVKAASKGWLRAAEFALKSGAKLDQRDKSDFTALQAACAAGHKAMVEWLLAQKADLQSSVTPGNTPLAIAFSQGRLEIFKLLLDHGAKPDETVYAAQKDDSAARRVPLLVAALERPGEWFELLMAHHANPNLRTADAAYLPVTFAARSNSADALAKMKRLLEAGAKMSDAANGYDGTLNHACDANAADAPERLKLLLKNGGYEWINALAGKNESALHAAARAGRLETVKILLDAGANASIASISYDELPVESAAKSHQSSKVSLEVVKLLLDHTQRDDLDARWAAPFPGRNNYSQFDPVARALMLSRAKYPVLAKQQAISFVDSTYGHSETLALAEGGRPVPSLLSLLTQNRVATFLNNNRSNRSNSAWNLSAVMLVRADAAGGWQRLPLNLVALAQKQDWASLPELRWGDILEFSEGDRDPPEPPLELLASLRKGVQRTITIKQGDLSRTLVQRGDRTAFDPVHNEVPLWGFRKLLKYFGGNDPRVNITNIRLQRRDTEAETVIDMSGLAGNDEPELQDGDTLKLSLLPTEPRHEEQGILLSVPGTLVSIEIKCHQPTDSLEDSLAHFLADEALVLPFPDLKRLALLRYDKDKGWVRKPLDLPAILNRERTQEDWLLSGDILELPMQTDAKPESWTGLETAETELLRKAMKREVLISTASGQFAAYQLVFEPRRWTWTANGGWASQPTPKSDSKTLRVAHMSGDAVLAALPGMDAESVRHRQIDLSGVNSNLDASLTTIFGDSSITLKYDRPVPGMAVPMIPQPGAVRRRLLTPAQ